jgi:hypothetical protein
MAQRSCEVWRQAKTTLVWLEYVIEKRSFPRADYKRIDRTKYDIVANHEINERKILNYFDLY